MCVGFLFVVDFGLFVTLASPELAMKNNLPLNRDLSASQIGFFWFDLFLRVVSKPRPASNSLCSKG